MNAYSLKKGFNWGNALFLIIALILLAGIFTPVVLRSAYDQDKAKLLANTKSIAGALANFKSDLGSYPCDATREKLAKDGIKYLPSGTGANEYLAQLLVSEYLETEKAFFAPGMVGMVVGDNIKGSSETLLSRGENSFAYVMAPEGKPLTDTNDFTPVILAPVKEIRDGEPIFDGGPYADKFVMGLADGSASAGGIDGNGQAISNGRESLIQTGPNSLFGNDTPVVKLPLIR